MIIACCLAWYTKGPNKPPSKLALVAQVDTFWLQQPQRDTAIQLKLTPQKTNLILLNIKAQSSQPAKGWFVIQAQQQWQWISINDTVPLYHSLNITYMQRVTPARQGRWRVLVHYAGQAKLFVKTHVMQ